MASTSAPSSIAIEPLARLRDVTHRYRDGTLALEGVSLEVGRAETLLVVGKNGSGKSTLLKLLAGRLRARSGEQTLRGAVSLATERHELDPDMTGAEHIALFAALERLTKRSAAERAHELSKRLELSDVLARRVSTYSGGMRRSLHLLLALLSSPELLLLDEPTSELDGSRRSALWALLDARRSQGLSQVIVTHDLDAALPHASFVCLIHDARIVSFSAPETLAEEHGGVQQAFRALTGERLEPGQRGPGMGRGSRGGRG